MTPEEKAAAEATAKAEAEAKVKKEAEEKELHDDAVKAELEKEKKRAAYSEQEKAAHNLKNQAARAKELGIDPLAILGKEDDPSDKDIPDWYKKEKAKEAQTTALQLADSIADSDVKSLVKEYLSNRIVPSGNAEEDFRLAYSAVSALKNKQILEEVNRRASPRQTAAGGSAPASVEKSFEPTDVEARMMKAPFNLSKEKILAARKIAQEKGR